MLSAKCILFVFCLCFEVKVKFLVLIVVFSCSVLFPSHEMGNRKKIGSRRHVYVRTSLQKGIRPRPCNVSQVRPSVETITSEASVSRPNYSYREAIRSNYRGRKEN